MSRDFGVTDGHPLYSLHRYRSDVRHMVIFDDLVEKNTTGFDSSFPSRSTN